MNPFTSSSWYHSIVGVGSPVAWHSRRNPLELEKGAWKLWDSVKEGWAKIVAFYLYIQWWFFCPKWRISGRVKLIWFHRIAQKEFSVRPSQIRQPFHTWNEKNHRFCQKCDTMEWNSYWIRMENQIMLFVWNGENKANCSPFNVADRARQIQKTPLGVTKISRTHSTKNVPTPLEWKRIFEMQENCLFI